MTDRYCKRFIALSGTVAVNLFILSTPGYAGNNTELSGFVNNPVEQQHIIAGTKESHRMTHDEERRRGKKLREEIEKRYNDLVGARALKSLSENNIDDVVSKYIPIGTSFDNAEQILRNAGFIVDPRPGANPPGNRPDRYDVVASINPLVSKLESKSSVYVFLSPSTPGKYTKVSKLSAGITTSFP